MSKRNSIIVFFGVFSLIWLSSFSFPFVIIPDVGGSLEQFFNVFSEFVGSKLFGAKYDYTFHSGEDSFGMLVNSFNCFMLASVVFLSLRKFINNDFNSLAGITSFVLRYYLALILMKYGFDKIYKWQFYYPEPNILFSRVKDLPVDMLYWTTMGKSYSYSLFAGSTEVIAGLLLLFRRTRLLGILISLAVLLNVFMINVGFDITIKLYSGYLLVLAIVLLLPYVDFSEKWFLNDEFTFDIESKFRNNKNHKYFKLAVIFLILLESNYKYMASNNFNDDLAKRPIIHGSYEVFSSTPNFQEFIRIHFHRQNYIIFEAKSGEFIDYKYAMNKSGSELQLTDYEMKNHRFECQLKNDTLSLKGMIKSDTVVIIATKVYQYP